MKNNIMIVTDSCSDIRGEEIKKYDVEVIPMGVSFGEEHYQEGVNLSVEEFYEKLEASKVFPKTSCPSPAMYESVFNKAKENNQEVIVLLLSSKLSGSFQTAKLAASMCDYEEHIHFVDTLSCLSSEKLLVTNACRLRDEGKTAEEICAEIEDIKRRTKIFSIVDTLEYFHKGGRLSKMAMVIGSIMGIKPFIDLDESGQIRKFGQAIGMSRALKASVQYVNEHKIDHKYGCVFGYTSSADDLLKLVEKVMPVFGEVNAQHTQIGATAGCHIGPGGICVAYIEEKKA